MTSEKNDKETCICCLDNSPTIKTECCQKLIFCQKCYHTYIGTTHLCPICRLPLLETNASQFSKSGCRQNMMPEKSKTLKLLDQTYELINAIPAQPMPQHISYQERFRKYYQKTIRKKGFWTGIIASLTLTILVMNTYFITDTCIKMTDAKDKFDRKIMEAQCNATELESCPIDIEIHEKTHRKYGILFKICLEEICIRRCIDTNVVIESFQCYYLQDELSQTLTIKKSELTSCFNHNSYGIIKSKSIEKKCEANDACWLMVGILGCVGTLLILFIDGVIIGYLYCFRR